MPRIPIVNQQRRSNLVQNTRANANAFGFPIGVAAEQNAVATVNLGKSLTAATEAAFEIAEHKQAEAASKQKMYEAQEADIALQQIQEYNDGMVGRSLSEDSDIYNFAATEKENITNLTNQLSSDLKFTNPDVARSFRSRASKMGAKAIASAQSIERKALLSRSSRAIKSGTNLISSSFANGTMDLNSAYGQIDTSINNYKGAINPEVLENMRFKSKQQFAENSINEMIITDPDRADELLASGEFDEFIGGKQKRILTNATQKAKVERAKKQVEAADTDFIGKAVGGASIINRHSKDHKVAVDNWWNNFSPTLESLPLPQKTASIVGSISKLGVYPSSLKNNLLGALENGTNDQKIYAAEVINRISEGNVATINQIPSSQRALAKGIVTNIDAGVSPTDAIKFTENKIFNKGTPEFKARQVQFKEESIDFSEDFVNEFFRDDPNEIPAGMVGEYNLLNQNFFMNNGVDGDAAKELAVESIKSRWGITETGGKRWMKYAPETIYDNGLDPKWIKEQLVDDVHKLGTTGFDIEKLEDDLIIEVAPETRSQPNPAYLVFVRDDNGVLEPVLDKQGMEALFTPDYETSPSFKRRLEENSNDIEEARFEAAQERQRLELERNIRSIREGF